MPGDGAAGDRAVQRLLERSSPTDLPRGEEQRLVHLATEVWTADVTGRGRGRWPGYFLSPRAAGSHASYQQVRVQAGIARKAGGGRVQVQLVWAGTGPAGDQRDGRLARLLFRILSHRWEPVR
ncbi:hypothetical protein ACFY0Z_29430 [Streptomyces kronopolitis]|uniref:hypothetical protein n=1 Tax=Streptomyces kronopolitis TaxID=1612435 RepID=UPI0036B35515